MLEVEIPRGEANSSQAVAKVKVSYANMDTKTTDTLTSAVAVRFSESEQQVVEQRDKIVLEAATMQVATARNELATKLRDEGKVEEAKKLLLFNGKYLQQQAIILESEELEDYGGENYIDSENLDASSWGSRRKAMRGYQYKNKTQQSY